MPKEKSCGAIVFKTHKNQRFLGHRKSKGFSSGQKPVKYLILHYEEGHWDFPKGHVDKGETEQETVKREVKEETGIDDIEFVKGFKETIRYFFRAKGQLINKEVVYYLVESKTEEVKLSFEHVGFEWLEFEDALKKLTFDNARDLLRKANELIHNKN